jgi:NAD(P)-dependent dehydrogenase (short-subunit alcohol dehydrogenase family)
MTDRSVVITGVSTGIGWNAASFLLKRNFRVFGSVRTQADADRLQKEFSIRSDASEKDRTIHGLVEC